MTLLSPLLSLLLGPLAQPLSTVDINLEGPCLHVADAALDGLRQAGAGGRLARQGWVKAPALPGYQTPYAVDLGVWVDASLLEVTPDAAALALRYVENTSCVLARGQHASAGQASHQLSLRLAGGRIRYVDLDTPEIPEAGGPWIQEMHRDWRDHMAKLPASPKAPTINVLFTARQLREFSVGSLGELHWSALGGASNGVGQGQAILHVDPGWFKNGMSAGGVERDRAEDWWGLLAAHELGHAMGLEDHVPQHYDTMCCLTEDYAPEEKGTTPAHVFFLSENTWATIHKSNDPISPEQPDPYEATPDPVYGQTWSYPTVHQFLHRG